MKTEKVPKLRFPEFDRPWFRGKLGNFIEIKSGISPSLYHLEEDGKYAFIKVEELNNCVKYQLKSRFYSNSNKNVIPINAVIFPKRGAAILNNKIRISGAPLLMDSNLMALICKEETLYFEFLYYLINRIRLYRIADTSTIPQLNNKHIQPYKVILPEIAEQTKIANFLTAVDAKIANLNDEKSLLENYKKGVMQKIFSKELRFKQDDGSDFPEWETKRGNSVFKSSSNKDHDGSLPILSASQQFGMVYREDNGIRIQATAESVKSYKVVEAGDFVISLRSFQGGIEYSKLHGICSPAYIILKPKIPIDSIFFKFYFKKDSFIERLSKTVVGIRDGKQITYDAFGGLKLVLPSIQEQTKIANFLTYIDEKINTATEAIEKAQEWKKGLLQQLFI